MDQADAIQLDNFYPDVGKCTVRRGTRLHATLATTGAVETLAELQLASGRKLLAAAGGGLWDATSGDAVATPLGDTTPFSSNRWQWVAMNDVLGLVNGQNAPQTFDGTTKAAMVISGSGLTPADLIGVHTFKSRSYFWTGDDQDFWYSAVNTLGGALTVFPLGDVGTFGGTLVAMFSVTRDGGSGPDDHAVFLMSSGEAIVYQGSNPNEVDDWALVGVYQIGAPTGIRAWAKLGGDVLIAGADGYSLFSRVAKGVRGSRGDNISDKIVNAAIGEAKTSSGQFGWQVLLYPRGRRLLVNHPFGASFRQHVVNLGTGAWCRFIGMDARCWALFGDALYFGSSNGQVFEADSGTDDNGTEIVANGTQAFTYLGNRSRNKHVTLVRPLLEAKSQIPVQIGLAVDFNPNPGAKVTALLGTAAQPGTKWGTAKWGTFKWGSTSTVVQGWIGHTANGYAVSPSITVRQQQSAIAWNATSLAYRRAGVV
jgi:hypothetical protein